MKKIIAISFTIALVMAFTAASQIQRGKKPAHTKPKTEKPSKPFGQSNSSKTNKTSNKKNKSSHSNGMTKAEKDRIIQKAIDDMVWVEGGTFMMGATVEQGSDADSNEKPAHQVTLSGYNIGKYEVTQALWQAVMGSNPSEFKGDLNRPVEEVWWDDCQKFLVRLKRMTGKRFRLPTEAEWEYAARGGNRSRGYKYAGSDNLDSVAWYEDNSGGTTHPVGQKSPNELGLYDMSGNVWEWCQDWKGEYSSGSQTNPTVSSSPSRRSFRGGGWNCTYWYCRVSWRGYGGVMGSTLGLRLAL